METSAIFFFRDPLLRRFFFLVLSKANKPFLVLAYSSTKAEQSPLSQAIPDGDEHTTIEGGGDSGAVKVPAAVAEHEEAVTFDFTGKEVLEALVGLGKGSRKDWDELPVESVAASVEVKEKGSAKNKPDLRTQRLKAAQFVRSLLRPNSYAIVVEHDLSVLDYLLPCQTSFAAFMGNLVCMGLSPLESLPFKFAETPQESAEEIETETYACYGYPTMTKTRGNFRLRVVEGEFTDSQIIVMLGENDVIEDSVVEIPEFNVSYKPQKIGPKFQHSVRHLRHQKIRDSYMHPQFVSDVLKPLQIEQLMDQEVVNLSGGELQRVALTLFLEKVLFPHCSMLHCKIYNFWKGAGLLIRSPDSRLFAESASIPSVFLRWILNFFHSPSERERSDGNHVRLVEKQGQLSDYISKDNYRQVFPCGILCTSLPEESIETFDEKVRFQRVRMVATLRLGDRWKKYAEFRTWMRSIVVVRPRYIQPYYYLANALAVPRNLRDGIATRPAWFYAVSWAPLALRLNKIIFQHFGGTLVFKGVLRRMITMVNGILISNTNKQSFIVVLLFFISGIIVTSALIPWKTLIYHRRCNSNCCSIWSMEVGFQKDEQPDVQGPGVWVSTERGATNSPIEYTDISAYRLSLSEDTKALNQLNTLIHEGKDMASVLYTY
ncbi:hypothetical protein RHMOL_Rhmol03G0095200 [Rhododendron molle]|uniref:Uncharacterized protein n=1 Tax=Rhododendron molle TaxID=49168 RepID=A0ACC0PET1_RHOML|nr:hypothetical protein RHMOL_Rhmol03G0095200 [Rhododendron molle]